MNIHFISCLLYLCVDNVYLLLSVRFIQRIGFGATANAIITIESAVLPKKRYGEAFGYFMLGTTLAVGLGPYIGEIIYDSIGSNECFLVAALFSGIALVSISLIDVNKYQRSSIEKQNDDFSGLEKVFEIKAIPVSLFTALTSLGYVSILSFIDYMLLKLIWLVFFLGFFIVYSVVLLLSRPIAGRIQDKNGDMLICVVGILAQSFGLFLIAVFPCSLTVFVCAVCAALDFGTFEFCM